MTNLKQSTNGKSFKLDWNDILEIGVLLLTSIGLSMDAFAVAVCKGLKMPKFNLKQTFCVALFFGVFQAVMPFIGWLIGVNFEKYISRFDHWIAFVLLALIGGKMIFESFSADEETNARFDIKELTVLAVATSIDALAVGIAFAVLPQDSFNIFVSVSIIGVVTFILSAIGVIIGNRFGAVYKNKAELAGGIILILIGLKILFEHLGIISF